MQVTTQRTDWTMTLTKKTLTETILRFVCGDEDGGVAAGADFAENHTGETNRVEESRRTGRVSFPDCKECCASPVDRKAAQMWESRLSCKVETSSRLFLREMYAQASRALSKENRPTQWRHRHEI